VASQSHPRHLSEQDHVVYAIAYSPDGQSLAAVGFDDKVHIYGANDGRLLRELVGPGNDIRAVCFSPDGKQLAAAGRSGRLRIWQSESGQQVADIQLSTRRICAVTYSPDGKYLAVGGQQRIVRLVDTASAKPVADLPERPGEVLALCFCGPDLLASAGSGNAIHFWNVTTHQELSRLVGHTGSVTTLVFHRAAGTLISGGYDTTVRLWDVKNWEQEKVTRR
jgi:WD40 repeat protein